MTALLILKNSSHSFFTVFLTHQTVRVVIRAMAFEDTDLLVPDGEAVPDEELERRQAAAEEEHRRVEKLAASRLFFVRRVLRSPDQRGTGRAPRGAPAEASRRQPPSNRLARRATGLRGGTNRAAYSRQPIESGRQQTALPAHPGSDTDLRRRG